MTRLHESVGYSARMALVACPFCRELFEEGEATACPLCGVALTAFEKLPAAAHPISDDGITVDPIEEVLPFGDFRRGRGALAIVAVLGGFFFLMPWFKTTLPDVATYTGFDVARAIGWTWGAGIAWVVLLATVLSRRTIFHMRGARVATAFLSAFPAITAASFLWNPPVAGARVPVHFTFGWGLYAVIAAGIAGVLFSLRFGGRVDVVAVKKGSSTGHTLH